MASKRYRVFHKTLSHCYYCGKPLLITDTWGAVLDHIIPASKGGSNDESNLIACCGKCNTGKSNKTITEFRELKRRQAGGVVFSAKQIEYLKTLNITIPPFPLPSFWGEDNWHLLP